MTLRNSFALLVAAARLACDCATSTAFRRSSAETRATLPRAADWILVAAASRTARIAASLAHAGVDVDERRLARHHRHHARKRRIPGRTRFDESRDATRVRRRRQPRHRLAMSSDDATEKTRAHVPFVSGDSRTRRDADGGRRRRNPRQPIRGTLGAPSRPARRRRVARGRTLQTSRSRVEIVERFGTRLPDGDPDGNGARHADRIAGRIVRRLEPARRRTADPSMGRRASDVSCRRLRVMRRFRGADSNRRSDARRAASSLSILRGTSTGGNATVGEPRGGTRARPWVVPPHRRGSPFARRLVGRASDPGTRVGGLDARASPPKTRAEAMGSAREKSRPRVGTDGDVVGR